MQPELEEKIKELSKPGVVFSEPVQSGEYTLITVSRYQTRKGELTARPVGVIILGPDGVEVRYFRSRFVQAWSLAMIASIVFWSAMILHPPWRENVSLLPQVKELINTIRER